MNKEKIITLFGAGAVIDWNAPSTKELTELVRDSGFRTTDNKTRITEFIYLELKTKSKYPDEDINFETIINVIEEFIVYYSSFNERRRTPSILKSFFISNFEKEILNFSIEGGETKHGFKLEIPKGVQSEFAMRAINNETPEQFFFQLLLAEIITNIVDKVSDYSYHSKGNTRVLTKENIEINNLFLNWIKNISQNKVLRMYTLNYDRNFKIILENSKITSSIFEGFECDEALEYGSNLIPNIPRIFNDMESNIHYNLHGSAFWKIETRYLDSLPNPTFYLTEGPVLAVNSYELPNWQIDKGKTIFVTNIITGYQKTQRGIFPPFKQMQSSFDKDCCFASKLYIIGYSFSDEHINASIKTALQHNENLEIVIVDPAFSNHEYLVKIALQIFSIAGNAEKLRPVKIGNKINGFFDGKFEVHMKTFKEYLKDNLED